MPPVKKPQRRRRPHFIRQWRERLGLTQEQVADRVGISPSNLGRIENNKVPYNQDLLEEVAYALMCDPWDLLHRDPTKEGEVIDRIDQFRRSPEEEQKAALDFLEFQRTRNKHAG